MDNNEFRHWSVKAAEWGVDYRTGLRDRPVRPDVKPGSIFGAVAASAPEQAEPMEDIFADFEATIVPGMTHWQHPRFFAYFPANAAPVSVVAEYLVSAMAAQCMLWQTGIINYSEWSVPLGRRFRALKLWFLLRAHGLEGLRTMIRNHVAWSEKLAERLRREPGFEISSEPMLSLFSFRHVPGAAADLDQHNLDLVERINRDGRIYLTQTRLDGRAVIRFQAGQFEATEADVDHAFEVITEIARAG
ncbi:hypothetical protein CO731_03441 [Aminobacter sp. MSH1]|uniref:pyridoxal-dependent decarboxylase n=1 Tax=Aminobacter sp. MSH1 TaxID=374606 RepID=UPI000D3BE742|nr:pyridoxal-dependent decarboxylase [Aminobacter sp. MSH1]AWC23968.1 hypothetical protein CO731_03441 [Aminobacter sp. MSH1]